MWYSALGGHILITCALCQGAGTLAWHSCDSLAQLSVQKQEPFVLWSQGTETHSRQRELVRVPARGIRPWAACPWLLARLGWGVQMPLQPGMGC